MQKPDKIRAQKLIGEKLAPYSTQTTQKDAILYSIGVGFSRDPLRQEDYKYTNQFNEQFTVFPTMAVVITQADLLTPLIASQNIPSFNPFVLLHAEHKTIMVKPQIQPDVEYQHHVQIVDCMDKGKNAFVLFRSNSYCKNAQGKKQLAFINQSMAFIRGLGGFNYPGKGIIKPTPNVPQRKPDYTLSGSTFPNQAFVYRLCFDMNPLHIVPSIAKSQNFERPILHGLATFGTIARVIVQQIFDNDPSKIKSFGSRFVGHVFPGQSLEILVWKQGDSYYYQASVKQRKTKAIVGQFQARPSAKL